jgi:hypothetical protein
VHKAASLVLILTAIFMMSDSQGPQYPNRVLQCRADLRVEYARWLDNPDPKAEQLPGSCFKENGEYAISYEQLTKAWRDAGGNGTSVWVGK